MTRATSWARRCSRCARFACTHSDTLGCVVFTVAVRWHAVDVQGWTLLGMTCPMDECYTPLVRSKLGKTYCVSCDQYFLTEEEAKKKKEEEDTKKKEQLERDAAAELEAEEERKRRIAQQFRLEEDAKRAREMQELEQARRARATSNSSGMCS